MENEQKTYRVEIFKYSTGETISIIGKGLSESRAEKREMTGLSRCNSNYGVRTIDEDTGEVL